MEIDKHGYPRKKIKHSDLMHRQIAYREIYLKNRDKYPLPFSKYQVHHKDGNKKNYKVSNLQIVTREEHERIHKIGKQKNISKFVTKEEKKVKKKKTRKKKVRRKDIPNQQSNRSFDSTFIPIIIFLIALMILALVIIPGIIDNNRDSCCIDVCKENKQLIEMRTVQVCDGECEPPIWDGTAYFDELSQDCICGMENNVDRGIYGGKCR